MDAPSPAAARRRGHVTAHGPDEIELQRIDQPLADLEGIRRRSAFELVHS